MIKTCIGLHLKYSLFFSGFNETWIFSTHKYENRSSGSCSMRTGGQTDRQKDRNDKANGNFSQFYESA